VADATRAGYAAIAVGLILLEAVGRLRGRGTAGQLLEWLMRGRAWRLLLILGWAWLGWHLFAR